MLNVVRSSLARELTALSRVQSTAVPEELAPPDSQGGGASSDQGGGAGAALGEGGGWVWKVVRIFLVPLPSQAGGPLVQLGKLDALFWWPLIVLGLVGIRQGVSRSWQRTVIVAIPIVVLAIFYAVVLNNAGTILRYRAGMFPLGAVLAGLGIDRLAARAPAPLWVPWKRVA